MRNITLASILFLMMVCTQSERVIAQVQATISEAEFAMQPLPSAAVNYAAWQETSEPRKWEPESAESENPYSEPMETDRHDFTQSTEVVGCGVIQLEYGFLYAFKDDEDEQENTFTTPELLIRYGLTDRLEIRSRWNVAWKFFSFEEDIEGMLDPLFSLKYRVSEQRRWVPNSALELRTTVPLGGDDLSTGRWEPGIDFIYGWEFGEFFSLTGSTGATANGLADIAFIDATFDPRDQFFAWSQSAALGAKLTGRTTGYFEWFGIFANSGGEGYRPNYLNIGVDYLFTKNMLVDVRLGWGLNNHSDELFAGMGGAVRF